MYVCICYMYLFWQLLVLRYMYVCMYMLHVFILATPRVEKRVDRSSKKKQRSETLSGQQKIAGRKKIGVQRVENTPESIGAP
jgi:hypothetical protein